MLIGNKSSFAIDTHIEEKLESKSLLGIGYFNIILADRRFGVCEVDATTLGCSYDNIVTRINDRGNHVAPFGEVADAHSVAKIFRDVMYINGEDGEPVFDLPRKTFMDLIYNNKLMWAPDGDEAFDDGSFVLHFDIGNDVRLIGFYTNVDTYCDEDTLVDIRISANEYYGILDSWRSKFEKEMGLLFEN